MKYRVNKRTGDKISELGFGTAYIGAATEKDARAAIATAYEGGVNYFDLATSHAKTFEYFGSTIAGIRQNLLFQLHFGANYETGEYGWTTSGDKVKAQVDWMLKTLRTDYIDYGFIHCLDEKEDWENYRRGGALDYLMALKQQGVVRHIGLSSHTPSTIQTVMDAAEIDMLMFSVNPGYDYHKGEYARGSVDERTAVYRRCETEGVGISVMKPFAGGQMLDAKSSPFGTALTRYQCMQFALDKPGVLTILPGMANAAQVKHMLGFFDAEESEKDYSVIGSFKPADALGKCVYCNHCKPCPKGIDIGTVNKYYDLAANGDAMAAEHYMALSKHAEDCIACGHCNKRCPFGTDQMKRMEEIKAYFGK